MKKDGFFALRVYPILFMAAVTVVCISITSGIYLSTEELVKSNETLFIKRAVLASAGIPVPETGAEVEKLYARRVRELVPGETSAAAALYEIAADPASGGPAVYAVVHSGPGLWGEITAVVGFKSDFSAMTGIEFIEQSETPGLGARIAEPWFKEQFRGKMGPFTVVPEGTAARPDEMDGITGATRTSDFVRQIINDSIERARTLAAQGGGNE